MDTLINPLVYKWFQLALQSEYYPYKSTLSPGQTDLICIDKDIPRTFHNLLDDIERTSLRKCLSKASAQFSELGYRSGFSSIVAVLNKLTNCNENLTMTIFKYILFSKNIGLGKILLEKQEFLIMKILGKLIKREVSGITQEEGQLLSAKSVCSFISFLTLNIEWQNVNLLALVWDRILSTNIFMLLQILLKYVILLQNPKDLQFAKFTINSSNIEQLLSTELRPTDEYSINEE